MKVKLCGFKDEKSIEAAISQNCDFIGFIFYEKSPRFVTVETAVKISANIPQNIAKVAVVVDPSIEFLTEITQKFSPQFFQFHGSETTDFLLQVRQKFPQIKIIKAFKIESFDDLQKVRDFENLADIFLFDGKNAGSGKQFDWTILQNFSAQKKWFLSGGLNINNIEKAIETTGALMIDISSGIEEIRGQKSPRLIAEFMAKIRDYDSRN
jgi:phosphoribosylanthranilate isomerase